MDVQVDLELRFPHMHRRQIFTCVLFIYSSRDTILNCIKDHLTKCMNEEQVMFIGTGKEYSAAYECMCGLNNAGKIRLWFSCDLVSDCYSDLCFVSSQCF